MGASGSDTRYIPAEDTYLLRDALASFSGDACLEIGFGSGAVISSVSARFRLAVGTDVLSLREARLASTPGVELVLCDMARCFRDESFDLVFFNPPYLPSTAVEDRAIDGGPGGIDIPISFVKEGLRVITREGAMLCLLSDKGELDSFKARCREMGLEIEPVARKKLFYESLFVFRMRRRG
jgi:release factor glutamine methyltransferase